MHTDYISSLFEHFSFVWSHTILVNQYCDKIKWKKIVHPRQISFPIFVVVVSNFLRLVRHSESPANAGRAAVEASLRMP